MPTISRRELLRAGVVGAASAPSLSRLAWGTPADATPAALVYSDWRDLYRAQWRWDRVVRGTHTNVNCFASCAWNLYVRDGIVWREEQSAPYDATNESVPDFNPRGCQKGATCSDLLTGPTRIDHPLQRVGPRGSGRWKRVSWDDALNDIARKMVATLAERGGEGILAEVGGNIDAGQAMAGVYRFLRQIGVPSTDYVAQLGDLPVGAMITLGAGLTGGSADDWFRSDYLVIWTCNPAVTRIPDVHFINEARYRGASIVTITPEYCQSAIHADLWMGVRPGSDAALALSACHVVLEEGLYQADYAREQTDLPFLVRSDTARFLREADLVEGGRDDRFAVWDETNDALAWAPGTPGSETQSLTLEGLVPALEKSAEVRLASGARVAVRTVFSILRERIQNMSPEHAAPITGLGPDAIRRFAREFASAPSAMIISSLGACKLYHADLIQRAQILLASLTGNLGRAGGGWQSGAMLGLEGQGLIGALDSVGPLSLLKLRVQAIIDPESLSTEMRLGAISGTVFHAVHGGIGEVQLNPEYGDPALPRAPREYLEEAIAKGHFPTGAPADGDPPEIILSIAGNSLRHIRMGHRVRDTLFANAKLVVDVGICMSETARNADFILPAAGWYEKVSLKYMPAAAPFVTLGDQAVPPLGETKPEWEIFSLLARHIAEAARERGVDEVRGFDGEHCAIAHLDTRFSDDGEFPPEAHEKVVSKILELSSASEGIGLDDLRRAGGAIRVKALGPDRGIFSDYVADEPIVPLRNFVEKKEPWKTLTGRQQFYIDHPWFLEVGEELPMHKEPPLAGGDYPFTLTGGHARWSIHSMWRDQDHMLRLQRGEPIVYLNDAEAKKRGISDHDQVRVWNDLGSFVARVKTTATMRAGQLHIFHAWEPYQFKGGRTHQHLTPSPIKVTQLVRDYGHLRPGFATYEPNQVDRDTRVNVERLDEALA